MKRSIAMLVLVFLIVLIGKDSYFHFDRGLIELKLKHFSDQRNWNLFYGQNQVFGSGSLRYQEDFSKMQNLVEEKSLLLSDFATSYHAAAALPVYVINVNRHHWKSKRPKWRQFVQARYFCYQEFEENREKVRKHLLETSDLDYVIVNRDFRLMHRNRDCLAFRSKTLTERLPDLADLLLKGEYLDLYRIRK